MKYGKWYKRFVCPSCQWHDVLPSDVCEKCGEDFDTTKWKRVVSRPEYKSLLRYTFSLDDEVIWKWHIRTEKGDDALTH